MKVLDLFSGLGGWSQAFEERGHEVVTVDIEEKFAPTVVADVFDLKLEDVQGYDVILASPPCECFSVLRIGRNWTPPPENAPKNEKSKRALELVTRTVALIMAANPKVFIIENPRGKLRRLLPVQHLERRTITYCQYGAPWQKPTDLWGGFPEAWVQRPECRQGATCHIPAPRGSRTSIQSDSSTRKHPLVEAWNAAAAEFIGKRHMDGGSANLLKRKTESRRIAGTSNAKDLAAFRALVPYELSLEVCLACEKTA